MGTSTFSGPVVSEQGFKYPVTTTALLPVLAAEDAGITYIVTDNGAANNERCIVQWTGAAWVTALGAALT